MKITTVIAQQHELHRDGRWAVPARIHKENRKNLNKQNIKNDKKLKTHLTISEIVVESEVVSKIRLNPDITTVSILPLRIIFVNNL